MGVRRGAVCWPPRTALPKLSSGLRIPGKACPPHPRQAWENPEPPRPPAGRGPRPDQAPTQQKGREAAQTTQPRRASPRSGDPAGEGDPRRRRAARVHSDSSGGGADGDRGRSPPPTAPPTLEAESSLPWERERTGLGAARQPKRERLCSPLSPGTLRSSHPGWPLLPLRSPGLRARRCCPTHAPPAAHQREPHAPSTPAAQVASSPQSARRRPRAAVTRPHWAPAPLPLGGDPFLPRSGPRGLGPGVRRGVCSTNDFSMRK